MHDHKYLLLFASILMVMFIIYAYYTEHKIPIGYGIFKDKDWISAFTQVGLNKSDIDLLEHDSDVWYYNGNNTCVAYGSPVDKCDYASYMCSNGSIPNVTHGTRLQQAKNVVDAIRQGGLHKDCPVIYF